MKPLPIIVALVMVLSSGLVHGLWTERWVKSEVLERAVECVNLVPLEINHWKGQPQSANAAEFKLAGAASYWVRQYRSLKRVVTVMLMCGRPGRMSTHTPDICYQGLGYQLADGPVSREMVFGRNREKALFFTGRFAKELGMASDLRLWWAWNDGRGWQAPSRPRWDFRRAPFLYKLYVIQETSFGQRLEDETGLAFLKDFLPEMSKVLLKRD